MLSRVSDPGARVGISQARIRLFDALLVLWVAAWVLVAVWVGVDLHHLDGLATTLSSSGQALGQTAQALQGFTHLPLVGGNVAQVVTRIATTAAQVQHNAATTRSSVDQISYLLAVVIAVIPSVSGLVAYLPFRVAWRRQGRENSLTTK